MILTKAKHATLSVVALLAALRLLTTLAGREERWFSLRPALCVPKRRRSREPISTNSRGKE